MERNENGLYSLPYRDGEAENSGDNAGGCRCEGCGARQLAMVYSPMQCWRRLYTPDEALTSGTLFEELYKPYEEVW